MIPTLLVLIIVVLLLMEEVFHKSPNSQEYSSLGPLGGARFYPSTVPAVIRSTPYSAWTHQPSRASTLTGGVITQM